MSVKRATPLTRGIAQHVLLLRRAHGWSQDELARRVRLCGQPWARGHVAQLETFVRQTVSADELVALAKALGIDPVRLLESAPYALGGIGPHYECACCGGDPDTVCDACGNHSCWAGDLMCEAAVFGGAGTTQAPQKYLGGASGKGTTSGGAAL